MVTVRRNQTLKMLLSGAVSTTEPKMTVQYQDDEPTNARTTTRTVIVPTTGATAATLLTGTDTGRTVKAFKFYNEDTATVTVTLRVVDNGTNRTLHKQSLLTGETMGWNPERGWHTLAVDGSSKTTAAADSSASASASAATSAVASGSLNTSSAQSSVGSASLNTSSGTSNATSAVGSASLNTSSATSGIASASLNTSSATSGIGSASLNTSTVLSRCVSRAGC